MLTSRTATEAKKLKQIINELVDLNLCVRDL